MKKTFAALALAVLAYAPAAYAQSPAYNWTGCYIGANVGGGWNKHDSHGSGSVFDYNATADGFVGGGQVGCDYQFASAFVVGVQGLWEWSDLRSSTFNTFVAPDLFKANVNEFGSLTARLGYLINPATLVYVKGGIGNIQTKFENVNRGGGFPNNLTSDRSSSASVIGGGLEWMFAPQWTLSIDYERYETDREFFLVKSPGNAFSEDVRQRLDKVTIGLNYRFGAR